MAKKEKKQTQTNQSYDPRVPNVQSKTQPQSENCKNGPAKS